MREHALDGNGGDAVAHLPEEHLRKLVGAVGDDLEFQRLLVAAQHAVTDGAADIAVDDAHDDGLKFAAVDKERNDGNTGVENEDHPDKTGLRPLAAHPCRDQIHAAGRTAAAEQNAVDKAADGARRDRPENEGGAVFGVVLDGGEIDALEQEARNGKDDDEHKAADGKAVSGAFPGQKKQRQIDRQRQIADVDVQQILDHGDDAIDPGRCEGVRKDKDGIAQRHQHSHGGDDEPVAPVVFDVMHGRRLRGCFQRGQYSAADDKMQAKFQAFLINAGKLSCDSFSFPHQSTRSTIETRKAAHGAGQLRARRSAEGKRRMRSAWKGASICAQAL